MDLGFLFVQIGGQTTERRRTAEEVEAKSPDWKCLFGAPIPDP